MCVNYRLMNEIRREIKGEFWNNIMEDNKLRIDLSFFFFFSRQLTR